MANHEFSWGDLCCGMRGISILKEEGGVYYYVLYYVGKKTAYDIASAKGYDDIMKILQDASYAHPAATEMSDEYRVVMVEQAKQPANSGLADVDVSTNI